MVQNSIEEIKAAVVAVQGKGNPIVSTGTTESGKSTMMAALAKNSGVQELLSIREADGKGSTSEVEIIATDYEGIPEDKLVVMAKLGRNTIADCNDDNDFIGSILYTAAKDYNKNPNIDVYRNKIIKTFQNSLNHPANESLAYKIREMSDSDFDTIAEILNRFAIDDVMTVYNEMVAKKPNKGQNGVKIFIELLSGKQMFTNLIEEFWRIIVDLVNRDVIALKDDISNNGAYVEVDSEGNSHIIIVLGEEDKDSSITETLLKSEDGSKEYLLSNISLIFRGDDYIFNVKNSDLLIVSEHDGQPIRCLRLIDTQGLFHSTGVTAKEESERIIDMLSEYHSNKLILVVNSYITDTVKDGYEAIRTMLQDASRDVEIYLLYTHWDEYLKTYSQQRSDTGKFSRGRGSVDWKQKLEDAITDQDVLISSLESSLSSNNSKKKPHLISINRAAILTDPENKMEDELENKGFVYPRAMKHLLEDVLCEQAKFGPRPRVIEGIEKCITVDLTNASKQDISSLYNNLVVECKGLKLYASTVRAGTRKWRNSGTVHKSYVVANEYGFNNIETKFVQEIRNYAMTFRNKLQIDATGFVPDVLERNKFCDDVVHYLTTNQNLGREVAELIGDEAYKNGFEKNKGFSYQYDRFKDMLEYTQDIYFNAPNISPTAEIVACLNQAIDNCVKDFVDANCIVIY
jgi:hypothetical protein